MTDQDPAEEKHEQEVRAARQQLLRWIIQNEERRQNEARARRLNATADPAKEG